MNARKIAMKIAREMMAAENIGDAFYRIMSESPSQISVTFHIDDTSDTDKMMGWFDANLSRYAELSNIASKYKYKNIKGMVDMKTSLQGMMFPICFEGEEGCDTDGFINDVVKTYRAKEIK